MRYAPRGRRFFQCSFLAGVGVRSRGAYSAAICDADDLQRRP